MNAKKGNPEKVPTETTESTTTIPTPPKNFTKKQIGIWNEVCKELIRQDKLGHLDHFLIQDFVISTTIRDDVLEATGSSLVLAVKITSRTPLQQY